MENPLEDSMTCSPLSNNSEGYEDLDWDGLLDACRQKEEQLNRAGEFGLKLVDEIQKNQNQFDEIRSLQDQEIEHLVQESFELKTKLEVKERALLAQEHDFEEFQRQITKKHENDIEEIQENMRKELKNAKKEKDSANNDLEQAQFREQQLAEQIESLKKRIQELQSENMQKVRVQSNTSEQELFSLREQNFILEENISELQQTSSELSTKNQTLVLELTNKIKETDAQRTELEELEMRCTTYFNHLQQAREEKMEIKTELDLLKAETRNSSHKTSGNSLFSEVEDKRIEMEKKLLAVQVKHDSLLRAYNCVKNQLHNMKNQVYALLQVKNARADEDHISRLERALSQAKSENALLTNKLKTSEDQKMIPKEELVKMTQNLPEFRKTKDLVDFLYSEINEFKSKLDKLQKEYDTIYMIKIAESDKLHNAEQRLYETTARLDSSDQANMRLKLKLEETKNKLESETQKRKLIEKKFNYDSTNDIVPEGQIKEPKKIEKHPVPFSLRKPNETNNTTIKQNGNHQSKSKSRIADKSRFNRSTRPDGGFSTDMQWHKLPKEVLRTLGIEDKVSQQQNEDSVFSTDRQPLASSTQLKTPTKTGLDHVSHISSDDLDVPNKPRKVSFKDTPEKIPVVTNNNSNVSRNSLMEELNDIKENQENIPNGHSPPQHPRPAAIKDTSKPPSLSDLSSDKKMVSKLKQRKQTSALSDQSNVSQTKTQFSQPQTTTSTVQDEDPDCKIQ
ncbi:protein Spindly-like [Clytia hemisphaerica]|uniref:Uncharacterized protein n=1 Tax=Clytia hemisphaerica TaxID=252671 RepID=A0A7M5XLZ2_9CNID|eukprot:TCONS_00032420-protein